MAKTQHRRRAASTSSSRKTQRVTSRPGRATAAARPRHATAAPTASGTPATPVPGGWLEELAWVTVLAALFGVLTVILRGGYRVFELPKATVLWIAAPLAAVAWLGYYAMARPAPATSARMLGVLTGAFTGLVVASSLTSINPELAIVGRSVRRTGLVTWLSVIVLCTVAFQVLRGRPRRIVTLLGTALVAVFANAALIALSLFGIGLRWGTENTVLPIGLTGNSNFAGAVVAISVPLIIWWWRRSKASRSWVPVAVALIAAGALWAANSRAAFLAALAGVAVLGVLDRRIVPRWVTVPALGLLLVAVGVIAFTIANPPPVGQVQSADSLLRSRTLVDRWDMWRGSVGVVAARPLLGAGPDALPSIFNAHIPDDMTRPYTADKPHNIALAIASELGLPAFAVWVALLGLALRTSWRERPDRELGEDEPAEAEDRWHGLLELPADQERLRRELLAVVGAMLVAYLTQGMLSIDAVPLLAFGALLVTATFALSEPATAPVPVRHGPPSGLAVAAVALGLAAVAAVAVVAIRPLRADRGIAAFLVTPPANGAAGLATTRQTLDRLFALDPWNEFHEEVAITAYKQALVNLPESERRVATDQALVHARRLKDLMVARSSLFLEADLLMAAYSQGELDRFDAALAAADRFIALDDLNAEAWQLRAQLWSYRAQLEQDDAARSEAEADLAAAAELAERLSPESEIWTRIGNVYAQIGQLDRARAAFDEALRITPGYPRAAEARQSLEQLPPPPGP